MKRILTANPSEKNAEVSDGSENYSEIKEEGKPKTKYRKYNERLSSMEILPDIAISKIASYLQPQDLMACSAVCKKWREKFNNDAVWTPHLQFIDKFYNVQNQYKDMVLCPPYYETLQPLCVGRERYIRDQCLRFNCRAGLFTVEGFKPTIPANIIHHANIIDQDGILWLFLNTTKAIEVWDITNKPRFQCSTLKLLPPSVDALHIIDSKVYLVFCDFVRVYSFEHPKYELVLISCFFFDLDSPAADLQSILPNRTFQVQTKHIIHGKILIGYTGAINKSQVLTARMHFWNLEGLFKLKSMNIVQEEFICRLFTQDQQRTESFISIDMFEGDHNSVVIVVHDGIDAAATSGVMVFNLDQLIYYHFFRRGAKTLVHWCSVVNERVIICGNSTRYGFFISMVDAAGKDIVTKNLSRFGIECNSQFIFSSSKIHVKTADEVISIEIDDKITINRLLHETSFGNEAITVAGSFIFSRSSQSAVKMWDRDLKCWQREVPDMNGKVEICSISGIKHVQFSPKLICLSGGNTFVNVLSFW